MQITINTADILGDEATIRDEVINQVASALTTSMREQAKQALAEMLDDRLKVVVEAAVDSAAHLALDTKFTDTDEYGRQGKAASIRDRIADYVQAQCVFNRKTFSNDENPFTRGVREAVESEVGKFKKDFVSLINRQVVEQTLDMAVAKLREALGIKK